MAKAAKKCACSYTIFFEDIVCTLVYGTFDECLCVCNHDKLYTILQSLYTWKRRKLLRCAQAFRTNTLTHTKHANIYTYVSHDCCCWWRWWRWWGPDGVSPSFYADITQNKDIIQQTSAAAATAVEKHPDTLGTVACDGCASAYGDALLANNGLCDVKQITFALASFLVGTVATSSRQSILHKNSPSR